MKPRSLIGLTVVLILAVSSAAIAQQANEVTYTSTKLTENIYMLEAQGGNIGLFFGPDGLFLIDDQFAAINYQLLTEIARLTNSQFTSFDDAFLLNTHFHHDHTGGNEIIGEASGVIVAQENVRERLTHQQIVPFFKVDKPALKKPGLPVITFSHNITFHLNNDSLEVVHLPNAHTDGDAIVYFTKANVIHAGDIVFTGTYPFFDGHNGGTVPGLIKAVEEIIARSNDQTKIIPGHGSLTDLAFMKKYQAMLTGVYDAVVRLKDEGQTLEQVKAAKPTAPFDADFAGFIGPDAFIELVWEDLIK